MCALNLEDHDDFHYRILRKISEQPGISATKLYPAVAVAKSNLDEAIAVLLKAGLIEASLPGSARRPSKYSITTVGAEHLAVLRGPFLERRQSDLDAMSEDVEMLGRSLAACRGNSNLGYQSQSEMLGAWQSSKGQD